MRTGRLWFFGGLALTGGILVGQLAVAGGIYQWCSSVTITACPPGTFSDNSGNCGGGFCKSSNKIMKACDIGLGGCIPKDCVGTCVANPMIMCTISGPPDAC